MTKVFRDEEYLTFPSGHHDDMLDALSRFLDNEVQLDWPLTVEELENESYDQEESTGWMSS